MERTLLVEVRFFIRLTATNGEPMTELWLEGIRVLDFSRLLPGPFCTMLLADMGADVVKIEAPGGGDYARYYPPSVDGNGVFFSSVNRNKRSMTVNLKDPEGVDLIERLARDADVVIESFRPGVMDRLGVGYEALSKLNPKLIYCAISGYGQTGPYAKRAGHDLNYLAHTGLLDQTGEPEAPTVPGFQLADIAGGALYAALGICGALFHRERRGSGSFLDISMTEGALSLATMMLANTAAGHPVERSDGMLTGGIPSYDVYRTLDDRFLAVGPLEPKFWVGFVNAIESPELVHLGHATGEEGEKARTLIAEKIEQKTYDAWVELFAELDVCVEGVQTLEEVLESEIHRTREIFFELAGITQVRTPVTPTREHTPAPALGQHTEAILAELGYSSQEIEHLRKAETV